MGIPSYFSWLVRHFEKDIIHKQVPFEVIHQLYLDFNCAIHPVARSHPEYTIDVMCDNVVKYLVHLINYVNPSELLYIAIDGVAPVAKIKQQRLRRFKSVRETTETNQLRQQYGIPIPETKDFNMISPATHFMSILTQKITQSLPQLTGTSGNLQVIFSDASIPAEGEHKILQHLKTQPLTKNAVIYGLDSDLIMLSMCSHRENVVLVREDTFMKNNNVDLAIDKYPVMNYFIVSELKRHLYQILISNQDINRPLVITSDGDPSLDGDRVVRDYIVISFLLGNDFIPPFPSLRIRDGGIEKVILAYRHTIKKTGTYLCEKGPTFAFNVQFLITMFQILAQNEESSLRLQKQNMDRRRLSRAPNPTPHDYAEALEQYQSVEHLAKDSVDVLRQGWRERYYHYYFHIKAGHNPHRKTQIIDLCHDYLVALHWVARYYFIVCPNWTWFYPHEATPLLSDFADYLNSHQPAVNQVDFVSDQPISPYVQLLMILPPQSLDLIPLKYQRYMTSSSSPFVSYFPTNVELELSGCRYRWEAHPKIPLINPHDFTTYVTQQQVLDGSL